MTRLRTTPSFVFSLSKLRRVVLSGNTLLQLETQDQVSRSITELYAPGLEAALLIDVGSLEATGCLTTRVCGMSSHLASCELTSVPMELVEALPALRALNLSWNKIASLDLPPTPVPLRLQVLYDRLFLCLCLSLPPTLLTSLLLGRAGISRGTDWGTCLRSQTSLQSHPR